MVNEVEEMFNADSGNPNDVVKELFKTDDSKARSDLSAEQISIIARLYLYADKTNLPNLKMILNEFITLRISKDRKSRAEFVQAFQTADQMNKQGSMFNNLFRAFGTNK